MFSVLCSVFSIPLVLKIVALYEIFFIKVCQDLRMELVWFLKIFS